VKQPGANLMLTCANLEMRRKVILSASKDLLEAKLQAGKVKPRPR
jgi:hypothetical protein